LLLWRFQHLEKQGAANNQRDTNTLGDALFSSMVASEKNQHRKAYERRPAGGHRIKGSIELAEEQWLTIRTSLAISHLKITDPFPEINGAFLADDDLLRNG